MTLKDSTTARSELDKLALIEPEEDQIDYIDALIRDLRALDDDLTQDSVQLIHALKQNLDHTDREATEELEQLARLLGLEPATTPSDIVKAAIARLNPRTSGKEQMWRIRSAVRSPIQELPRPTRTRSAD